MTCPYHNKNDPGKMTFAIHAAGSMDTPLKNEETALGAQFKEYFGCLLPEAFAGFDDEYRAAREAVALIDTNWHATFKLTGPDRVRYLNAIVTNNVQALGEGHGTLALLLNPQGRILGELEISALKEELLVRTHASVREAIAAALDKYIIMDDVTLEDATDTVGSVAIEGPRTAAIVAEATGLALDGFSKFATAEVSVGGASCLMARRSHFGGAGAEFITSREKLAILWKQLLGSVHAEHGTAIGMKALNTLRLEAGVPWFPADFNDTVIPHEAALEETHISFSKGCYTGQEIVERVRSRGHVNRRRVSLRFSSSAAPAFATRLFAEGKEIGLVTSAAFSPVAGAAIGMGYVRREQATRGSAVEFDGGTATVSPSNQP